MVRIITTAKYNAHTEPIFKSLKLLKLNDLKISHEYKFYFKYSNNMLPKYFDSFKLTQNENIHNHQTRNRNRLHIFFLKHEFAKRFLRNSIIKRINECPPAIKTKVNTHSLHGFSMYIKQHFIQNYSYHCVLPNCYICQNH